MQSRLRVLALSLAAAVGHLLAAAPADAGQTTIFVNFSGNPFCDVCGAADYTIPGGTGWDNGVRTFADPLPGGAVPTQILTNIQGTCDDATTITVDGTFVGASSFTGTGCACGSCFDGSVAASAVYAGGFPGWITGGTQTLQVAAAGVALDGVDVTIVYRLCGDGVTDAGETCDQGGDTAACDSDCSAVACGDGHVNGAAGEACDASGETAACDADCTPASCGDGHVNAAAGEVCDVAVENAACDDDCTLAECGDGHTNGATGEICDDGNTDDGDGCSSLCQGEGGPTATSTGSGEGGAGSPSGGPTSGPGGGGEAAAGPTGGGADAAGVGPTANGIAVVAAAGSGGRDEDEGGDDDGPAGDGGASGDPAAGGSSDGCGCVIPARRSASTSGLVALAITVACAARRRRSPGAAS